MEPTAKERKEFERAFAILDTEKDGCITIKELMRVMHILGKNPTELEVMDMINSVDTDGNGVIEFEEFLCSMIVTMSQMPADDELREAFRIYDKHNSGYIGIDQIRVVMLDLNMKIREDELEELVREADIDGDGYLNFEEFVTIMTTK